MKDILDKIGTYNIFNYLLPGVLFAVLVSQQTKYNLLLRPDEVSSRITHPVILEVGDNSFGGFVQHGHVLVGRLA